METTAEELAGLIAAGAVVLNVGRHDGAREIRGAVRYRPHDLLEPERLTLPLASGKTVVLYDEDGRADLTGQIADRLRDAGFADVRVLAGGFAAWERAGGATQEPSFSQVVPPSRASEVQRLDRRV